jgi:predicted DNA-binding transcriptional regulator AlpA
MQIYRLPQVRERVPYSGEHIRRLEERGLFPRRFKLVPGTGKNGAVGWDADEIDRWIEDRKASREAG